MEYYPDIHPQRLSATRQDPSNPERTNLPQETLGLRWKGFSPFLSLLMPAGSLLTTPPVLTIWLHGCENAPLPICAPAGARLFYGFGLVLKPRWIVGPKPLDQ